MNLGRIKYLGLILLVLIAYQSIGYNDRNSKIETELVDAVVEQVIMLEGKRISNQDHSIEDHENLIDLLNYGEFSKKSNLEVEIVSNVVSMSRQLKDFSNNRSRRSLEEYYRNLSELKEVVRSIRADMPNVEQLWQNGIFQD